MAKLLGGTTVHGNLSAQGIIFSNLGNSDEWNSVYSSVKANSSSNWNYQATDIKSLTGNWQSSYSSVNTLSSNWNSVYSTVNANSATTWNYQGTDLKALSSNWQSTYSLFSQQSTNNLSVYSNVASNSANWNTAFNYSTVFSKFSANPVVSTITVSESAVVGSLRVLGDTTIVGNLSTLGDITYVDTKVTLTSSMTITNAGTGPALKVTQTGDQSIATFYDDNNVAFHIDGSVLRPGNIGVGTNTPIRKYHQEGGKFLINSNQGSFGQFQVVNPLPSEVTFVFGSEATPLSDGTISSTSNSYIWAFGIGSFGYSPDKFIIGNAGLGPAMLVNSSGNVAVGTINPNAKFEVQDTNTISVDPINSKIEIDQGPLILRTANDVDGSTRIEVLNGSSGGKAGLRIINEIANPADLVLENSTGKAYNMRMEARGTYTAGNDHEFQVIDPDTSDTIVRFGDQNIILGSTGQEVGIGTLEPKSRLHIEGSAVGYGVNDGNARFMMNIDTNNNPGIELHVGKYGYNKGTAAYIDFAITDDIDYDTRFILGTEKFYIQSNRDICFDTGSNIGISTTLPSYKLDVFGGAIRANNSLIVGTGNVMGLGNAYGQFTSIPGESAGFTINRGYNDSFASLDFITSENTASGWSIQKKPYSDDLSFVDRTNNNDAITLTVGGNVGIGTQNPTERLDVNGKIKASEGDSTQWNSVYSTVRSNSATTWNYQGTDLKSLTAGWVGGNSAFTTLNGLSANTVSVYSYVNATSGLEGRATTFVYNNSAKLLVVNSLVNTTSANWNSVYSYVNSTSSLEARAATFVYNNSANSLLVDSLVNTTSANWNSVYSTVNTNSAITWNYQGTDLKSLSAGWQSVFTNVNATSSNWNSVYSQVNLLSTSWEESADIIPTITNYLSTNVVQISAMNVAGLGTFNIVQASIKNFNIPHPIKQGKRLQYSSIESPYIGVQLTGKGVVKNNQCIVNLPEYTSKLIHEDNVQIQITNYKHAKVLYVDEINICDNTFTVKTNGIVSRLKSYEFFWSLTAERKDVPKLQVEV